MKTLPAGLPLANLLRLDPGERAPAHCHGRRDVTVVLTGSFADQFGVYERGDLAFAEPGIRHEPRAVGSEPCVCFLATEPGRPLRGFLGLLQSFIPDRAV
jgi:putative transcriptional regulator